MPFYIEILRHIKKIQKRYRVGLLSRTNSQILKYCNWLISRLYVITFLLLMMVQRPNTLGKHWIMMMNMWYSMQSSSSRGFSKLRIQNVCPIGRKKSKCFILIPHSKRILNKTKTRVRICMAQIQNESTNPWIRRIPRIHGFVLDSSCVLPKIRIRGFVGFVQKTNPRIHGFVDFYESNESMDSEFAHSKYESKDS